MSRRDGRELTEREQAVIRLVARFLVIGGGQLQRVFFPDGTLIGRRRRTQATLKGLVDDHYLTRLDRRVGGERAGSASYCYRLGTAGQRLLQPERRARRLVEPGLTFLRHHLAVVEVYVGLVEAERLGELELLDVQTEPTCWRTFAMPYGGSDRVKPDLFVALGVGDFELRWFIEVDLATESLRRVERTCDRYLTYYRSAVEQSEHGVFPRVLWLTDRPRRLDSITAELQRRPPADQAIFAVAALNTSNEALKGGDYEEQQPA